MPHGAGSKRRKIEARAQAESNGYTDTSKPTAVFKPGKGRSHTLSIALPSSIVANCQTHDLKTSLIGHIARALAVFSVDEIIIFSDTAGPSPDPSPADLASGYTGFSNPTEFMHHLLSYLETPPYLRKTLFPMHPDLRTAGVLPSLDLPSHLKPGEYCPYREGVTLRSDGKGRGTRVDCGLQCRVTVEGEVEEGTRVTVKLPNWLETRFPGRMEEVRAEVVPTDRPRTEGGYYWGYSVRVAGSLSAVWTEAEVQGGYDVSVGTSERGEAVDVLLRRSEQGVGGVPRDWQHLLVVFGGVAGLEKALEADEELSSKTKEVRELFDFWANLVPGQGSRTIRTEEAVWLGLMGLRPLVAQREQGR